MTAVNSLFFIAYSSLIVVFVGDIAQHYRTVMFVATRRHAATPHFGAQHDRTLALHALSSARER
jgi:hypothetical protein